VPWTGHRERATLLPDLRQYGAVPADQVCADEPMSGRSIGDRLTSPEDSGGCLCLWMMALVLICAVSVLLVVTLGR
jgi:hypothetical protein